MLRERLVRLERELRTPLFRNAYALMLNTLVNSALGILYWVAAARSFSPDEVGRNNALLSLMLLVSTLTQLNFGQALFRFLPVAGARSARFITNAYGISTAVAVVVASVVAVVCHVMLQPSDALYMSTAFAGWFVISTATWSVFNLQDAALTGLRSSQWVPLENAAYGLCKLGLLAVMALGTLETGIFWSWTLALPVFLIATNVLIFRRILPAHPVAGDNIEGLPNARALARYMSGDFIGQIFTQLSSTFLPILVVAVIDTEAGAYLLPAQTIWIAMNLLSLSITSSLVVEAAGDPDRAHVHAKAVLRRIAVTVLPAALIAAIGAPLILLLYGDDYRSNATVLLQLFMVSTVPRIVISLYAVMQRLSKRTGRLAVVLAVQAVILLGGSAAFAGQYGLDAVGWAAFASQALPAIVLAPQVVAWMRGPAKPAST